MGAVTMTYIYCDGKDCTRDGPFTPDVSPGETAAEQRRNFRINDWRHIKGKDYCPECVARMQQAKEEAK